MEEFLKLIMHSSADLRKWNSSSYGFTVRSNVCILLYILEAVNPDVNSLKWQCWLLTRSSSELEYLMLYVRLRVF